MGENLAPLPASDVVAILRTARDARPDARLGPLLAAFRAQWERLAQRRFPDLGTDTDDAVQEALLKLSDPARLDALRDPERVEAWGRSLFVRTVLDVLKLERPHVRGRADVAADGRREIPALVELLPSMCPSPEELAGQRERMALVGECLAGLDVGRLKFVDELSDLEIARRCNMSRDGVAGRLKRLRKQLRSVLDEADRIGAPTRVAPGGRT
jgi:RNA polymerase sigma factor (sigma-70 family)